MAKAANLIIGIIHIFSFILALLMFEFSLSGFQLSPGIALYGTVLIACLCFVFWKKRIKVNCKQIIVLLLVIGTVLRLLPLLLNWDYTCINDLSDTGVHYYGALELASGFLEENIITYEKMFPYLFPYTLFLSLFVRLCFGQLTAAICLSNLILDYGCVLLTYKALKKLNVGGGRIASIGTILTIINPFSIIVCWCPLNLVLINCLLLMIVNACLNLLHAEKNKSVLYWSCILGVLICLSNYFRPLFSIAAIAVSILLIIRYLRKKAVIHVIAVFVIAAAMLLPTVIINKTIDARLNENVMDNTGGWSFYVGSNYESKGKWSAQDRDFFFGEVTPYYSSGDARAVIMEKGVERYSSYSLMKLLDHIANKISVLFADAGNAIYDIRYCLGINSESMLYQICSNIVSAFFAVLTLFNLSNIINKQTFSDNLLLMRLLLLGFTASLLMVEVMNRYTFIMYPILIIICAIEGDKVLKKQKNLQ